MRPLPSRLGLAGLGLALTSAVAATIAYVFPSCQTYSPPPTAKIVGAEDGLLQNPLLPIVVQFSTPVDPDTVSVEIAPFDVDAYGNLPDELSSPQPLGALLEHTPTGDTHTMSSWSPDGTTLTLTPVPQAWLPIGPSLVLLVLPGVRSTIGGGTLRYRERLLFSYPAQCGAPRSTKFASGDYFFLLQVNNPIPVELKVFAAIDVNPQSGAFYGQFTAALRNSDPNRCNPPCTNGNVCELLPSQMCVEMSTPPVSVYEWPDFVFKATAPNGYTFEMRGCASDEGDAGAVNILTAPGMLKVSEPNVTIDGLTFTAQFTPTDAGLVLASGSLTATNAYLGTTDLGAGTGTLTALSIPDASALANLPHVGAFADAGDAGINDAADGG